MAELSQKEIQTAYKALGLNVPYYTVRAVADGIEFVTRDGPVVWQRKPKPKPKPESGGGG
jgi:hypothetical protein